jgi:hypothetical protein
MTILLQLFEQAFKKAKTFFQKGHLTLYYGFAAVCMLIAVLLANGAPAYTSTDASGALNINFQSLVLGNGPYGTNVDFAIFFLFSFVSVLLLLSSAIMTYSSSTRSFYSACLGFFGLITCLFAERFFELGLKFAIPEGYAINAQLYLFLIPLLAAIVFGFIGAIGDVVAMVAPDRISYYSSAVIPLRLDGLLAYKNAQDLLSDIRVLDGLHKAGRLSDEEWRQLRNQDLQKFPLHEQKKRKDLHLFKHQSEKDIGTYLYLLTGLLLAISLFFFNLPFNSDGASLFSYFIDKGDYSGNGTLAGLFYLLVMSACGFLVSGLLSLLPATRARMSSAFAIVSLPLLALGCFYALIAPQAIGGYLGQGTLLVGLFAWLALVSAVSSLVAKGFYYSHHHPDDAPRFLKKVAEHPVSLKKIPPEIYHEILATYGEVSKLYDEKLLSEEEFASLRFRILEPLSIANHEAPHLTAQ